MDTCRFRLVLCCFFMFWVTSYVHSWEFRLDGTFNYNYEYYGQQGTKGFFGQFDTDRSAGTAGPLGLKPGDFASVNAWVGRQIGRQGNDFAAGSDAVKHSQNLELWPEFRINPAIRFRAKYRVGAYGDPVNSDYLTNTRPGVDIATSDGQWTMWWITTQTPWGVIALGKRAEAFGTGIQFNGESNNTTEGLALDSSYGPLRINFALRPWWIGAPNQLLKQSEFPYYNISDKNGLRQLAARSFIVYQHGPLEMGLFCALMRWHAGPESQNRQADRLSFIPFDLTMQQGTAYLKYFNGRIFFNTELAFFYDTVSSINKGQNNVQPPAPRGPTYTQSLRYMTEFGVIAGPTKVSFLYAFMPGADRRAGRQMNNQPYMNQPGFGAYDVFKPCSYLMGYAYGSGVNAFDMNGNGYINEAWVLASRLDYAVATNLNFYSSFIYAERSSHGHSWGYVRPAQRSVVSQIVNANGDAENRVKWTPFVQYQENANAPTIPDNALGWEVSSGCTWKLLENYILGIGVSYWQPGNWFKHACVDKNVPNWDRPTATNRWGTNPDRTIDPIIGTNVNLQVVF